MPDGRVETADWEQLLNEIGRLEASAGQPFEIVDVAEVHDARLLPIAGNPLREIRFRLHTQDGNSRPIHVATVIEDGRERPSRPSPGLSHIDPLVAVFDDVVVWVAVSPVSATDEPTLVGSVAVAMAP